MSSRAALARVPSSRTVTPLTVTRPWTMSSSDRRREAMPARDRIFWSRSMAGSAGRERSAVKEVAPEASQLDDFADPRGAGGFGVRDQAGEQDALDGAPEIPGQIE